MQSPKKQSKAASPGTTSVLSVLSLLESFTLAVILAFVFRGFVVEAFVIPTGSMAETLMGEHTQTICPDCRYEYPTGLGPESAGRYQRCPNCGDRTILVSRRTAVPQAGDRVLVVKPMYFLSRYKGLEWLAPRRWDVVVFLYPGTRPARPSEPRGQYVGGQDNYIKRLAGLPGESIEIIDGDVFIDGQIARKPPRVQRAMWITVFDNDYQPQREREDWPLWQEAGGPIERHRQGRVLKLKALGSQRSVSYEGPLVNSLGYNGLRPTGAGSDTVGDLRLSFDAVPQGFGRQGELTAVLSKRGRYFRMRVDLAGPMVTVELQSRNDAGLSEGQTSWETLEDDEGGALRCELGARAEGKAWHLELQNADYQVSVWADGKKVLATTDRNYQPPPLSRPRDLAGDRAPRPEVAINVKDAEVELQHIRLDRDVYYTSPMMPMVPGGEARRDPGAAKLHGKPGHAVGQPFEIPPTDGHPSKAYFMLGDNSSDSQDSRMWWSKHSGLGDDYVRGTVPQSHIIGQAFFVYWPAAGPLVGNRLRLIPQVGKMRLIR